MSNTGKLAVPLIDGIDHDAVVAAIRAIEELS
jgi:hypothetical protein